MVMTCSLCLSTYCDDDYDDDAHDHVPCANPGCDITMMMTTIIMVAFTPLSRLEDRKFGFLLRNKTISLNICIDVREVFNAKVTTIIINLTSKTTMSAMSALTTILLIIVIVIAIILSSSR